MKVRLMTMMSFGAGTTGIILTVIIGTKEIIHAANLILIKNDLQAGIFLLPTLALQPKREAKTH
jgi:hypothetical protein